MVMEEEVGEEGEQAAPHLILPPSPSNTPLTPPVTPASTWTPGTQVRDEAAGEEERRRDEGWRREEGQRIMKDEENYEEEQEMRRESKIQIRKLRKVKEGIRKSKRRSRRQGRRRNEGREEGRRERELWSKGEDEEK